MTKISWEFYHLGSVNITVNTIFDIKTKKFGSKKILLDIELVPKAFCICWSHDDNDYGLQIGNASRRNIYKRSNLQISINGFIEERKKECCSCSPNLRNTKLH